MLNVKAADDPEAALRALWPRLQTLAVEPARDQADYVERSMGALALVLGAAATTHGLGFAVDLGAAAIILMNVSTLVLAMTAPFKAHSTTPTST
jgi:hypothetical protein